MAEPAKPKPTYKRSWSAPTKTAADTIAQIAANDPTLDIVDLSNSAVFQMRSDEIMASLAQALSANNLVRELNLANCGVSDKGCAALAAALTRNSSVCIIDLSNNCISSEGAAALAGGLGANVGVRELGLMNQSQGRWTDTCLDCFLGMFERNVTLLKIVWRLESRKSFAINKCITRNNEIDRRTKASLPYDDILPEALKGRAVRADDGYYADARAKPVRSADDARPVRPTPVVVGGVGKSVLSRWPPAMAAGTV